MAEVTREAMVVVVTVRATSSGTRRRTAAFLAVDLLRRLRLPPRGATVRRVASTGTKVKAAAFQTTRSRTTLLHPSAGEAGAGALTSSSAITTMNLHLPATLLPSPPKDLETIKAEDLVTATITVTTAEDLKANTVVEDTAEMDTALKSARSSPALLLSAPPAWKPAPSAPQTMPAEITSVSRPRTISVTVVAASCWEKVKIA